MAKRLFVHVGTPKTGTTFLQSVVWANKSTLQQQGLLLPLDTVREHFYLSCIVRNSPAQIRAMPASGRASWDRMMTEAQGWDGDVLLSHELFSAVPVPRAQWAMRQLASVAEQVHVVVTARDLARQIPAEWQQSIKHGRFHGLVPFLETIKAEDPTSHGVAERSVLFWKVQDLPRVLDEWGLGLPPQNVHVVTVPPSGAPRDLLWTRFATLVGVAPDSVDQSVTRPNESLGLAEIETLRRVNEQPINKGERATRARLLVVRSVLAEGILAARPGPRRFAVPGVWHPWIKERGTQMVEALRATGFNVVGDLADLIPAADPAEGPNPDDVDDTAVARVAVETISALLDRNREAQLRRLRRTHNKLQKELEQTQRQLRNARQMFREERAQPLRVHIRRRAGLVKRRLLRRPQP